MTTVYPAPGDRPLVADVPYPFPVLTVTCWCGQRWLVGGSDDDLTNAKAAEVLAGRHHGEHPWVNRWPWLLGPWAWRFREGGGR